MPEFMQIESSQRTQIKWQR